MKNILLIPMENESIMILLDFMDFTDFANELKVSKELENSKKEIYVYQYQDEIAQWN